MSNQDRDPEQLLTVADIASHIGAHEQTVRLWIKRGELPASTFGTRIGASTAPTTTPSWPVARSAPPSRVTCLPPLIHPSDAVGGDASFRLGARLRRS